MPDFAGSKTQLAAGKYACRASRPANTPARLAAWTASQNFVLLFSQPCQQMFQKNCGSQQASFRLQPANTFQTGFFTGHHTFRLPLPTSRCQPANNLSPHIFLYQPTQSSASQQPHNSGLTGQCISSLILFFFLFFLSFFFPPTPPFFPTKKETGFASSSFFFYNPKSNPSISFAISFTALLAVQSVYSSAQATQWSYINATRSPVSLILALISAIFFSSSFFNSF